MRDSAARSIQCYEEIGDEFGAMRGRIAYGEALTRLLLTDEAATELTKAWEYFTATANARWANYALSALSRNALWRGDMQLARDRAAQVLDEARAQGDDRLTGVMLNNLAEREFAMGNIDRAIEVVNESIEHDRAGKNVVSLCNGLANLAAYLIAKGAFDEAQPVARESLRRAIDVQNPNLFACGIQHLAVVSAVRGNSERAALLLGFTNTFFDKSYRETTEKQEYDWLVHMLQQSIGETRMNELLQRGATMRDEQAVVEALKV
jgi:tetratricopeptide (TPR) repeat protein